MNFKKLLSYFLSIAIFASMFTSLSPTVSAETFSETVTQTVYEMDIEAIKAGNLPAGVQINTEILDEAASSASSGLISDVMSAETAFLQIDLKELSKNFPGEDSELYTIELVANLNDSDSSTKNGTLMYINGEASKFALRARESSDFCVMNASWAQPAWNATTAEEAHYTITDLNLSTGAAASHLAQRKSGDTLSNQYSSTATGEALNAANAPISGLTFKVPANYRANIKSIKITRKAVFSSESYAKANQTVYEMDADALKAGEVPQGVTLNSSILSSSSSAASGLMSNTVTAETQFLKIVFADLTKNLTEQETGLYTIELVANLNDSDSSAKNGTLMYIDGAASKFALRARESSDFCVMNASWAQPAWNATTAEEAHYTITDLNLSTGAAASHLAQRKSGDTLSNQYSSTATGEALNAANAPISGLTFKVPANYRANIKSLKITRVAYLPKYAISVTSEDETHGTVAIEGLTEGKVISGNEVTLTATPSNGYVFKGWYKEGEDAPASTEESWTFTATESVNYVAKFEQALEVTQTVYELDIEALKAGNVPAGVTLNSSIFNETATSAETGLISDAMAAETAFLTLDLNELSKNLPGEDSGLYTIDVVVNQNDSDSTTKNGMLMSMTGTAKKDVWRVRESADIAVLNTWTSASSIFSSGNKSAATASYVFTDLNVNTGEAASHAAKYGANAVYTGYANGQAVEAGNASSETPINIIEFRTAKTSSGEAMRANIKSIKITRKALFDIVPCTINAITENETYGTVTVTGLTDGQVMAGNEVTLTATSNAGYVFKGWYKEGEDAPASTERNWTFVAIESANYTARFAKALDVTQVVYELDIEALKAGNVPEGVTLNSSILDEAATSAETGLISDAMAAETAFLTLDLKELSKSLPGEDSGLYTIDVVVNQNDSDSTTKNGMFMSMTGTAKKDVWRVRESADIAVLNTWTSASSIFSSGNKSAATASYVFTDLNVNTGAAASHKAKYGTSAVYNGYANGQAVAAGNATTETPINIIEFRTATSSGAAMRANIKSIKITRKALVELEYVSVEALSENDAFGIVSDLGDTAAKYTEVTLNAEAKEGYIFAGWYEGAELVSEEATWTFQVTESFSYTAKFRKVVEEWVEVYRMNVSDILAGATTQGVSISNIDTVNSNSTAGLMSAESDASQDFMTITFADLPIPGIGANDVLTDSFRVDAKFNLVDDDDTTKNGALVYYNEVAAANMMARMRETRDGTFYKDGSATVYGGTIGSQQIPTLAYNFEMDTKTGLFNQYVKHGVGDYYLFTDTLTRGDDITLPTTPSKIIIRNADYNSGGVNENYRVNIKTLSVKRLVKVVDTGNAVPMFGKDRVSVIAKNGDVWSGFGAFTTDVEKIIIDFGSEIAAEQITNDTVFITCDDEKINATVSASTGVDGITLATISGMTFENGKEYKIIADGIKNVRGASLHKINEYVLVKTVAGYEGIFVKNVTIGGNTVTGIGNITPNTDVNVNVEYTNVSNEKDVYVLYVAYKNDTKADIKIAKLENVTGSGNGNVTIKTGDVSGIEEVDFIIWEGWSTMRILDSFGF